VGCEGLNIIPVVGDHQLLQVRKHMQNFLNRWPETLKLTKNQRHIADFVRFALQFCEEENLHELYLSFVDQLSSAEPQRAETSSSNVRQTRTSYVDLYWRRVFGVSVHSRNRMSQQGLENRILAEIQNVSLVESKEYHFPW